MTPMTARGRQAAPHQLHTFLKSRKRIEHAVERLIDLLDAIDAVQEDLEPEFDDELDEDLEREPDEPSLGAPENHHDQRRWAQGCALFGVDFEETNVSEGALS